MLRLTKESRKYMRYELEEGNITEISFAISDSESYSVPALIINSSFGGGEFLLFSKFSPSPHQKIQVTFPDLGVFQARIVWLKELEHRIFTIGIEYLQP